VSWSPVLEGGPRGRQPGLGIDADQAEAIHESRRRDPDRHGRLDAVDRRELGDRLGDGLGQ
jgi:hypothetical protein